MCGIAGFWASNGAARAAFSGGAGQAMTDVIRHRGPDAGAHFDDAEAGVFLGHRRLAILDTGEGGAQPMASASGRYVIVYNGEVYNHLGLRGELEARGAAPAWRGHSDTETLLALIEAEGVVQACRRAIGMFAFAVWDGRDRELWLARDRAGEKPLLFGRMAGAFAFASELRSLETLPGFEGKIDEVALRAYLARGCIPGELCIYAGLRKLRPGCVARLRAPGAEPEIETSWSLSEVLRDTAGARGQRGGRDTIAETEAVLQDVVASHMLSDVPLGSFLSGGIDSSLVTALMVNANRGPVRTFSIGFDLGRFDESAHARTVAAHLGTTHTEFRLRGEDALKEAPALAAVYDEPFADSSALPTLLLSRLARDHVTVALTGDGGDEVFGGYNRHILGPSLLRRFGGAPGPIRPAIAGAIGLLARGVGGRGEGFGALARRLGLPVTFFDRLGKVAGAVDASHDARALYAYLLGDGRESDELLHRPAAGVLPLDDPKGDLRDAELFMALDFLNYMPADVLTKVDRAAMAASLETRAPLLDARTVEQAWRLPIEAKVDGGIGKRALREILYRHVPRELIDRPKQGFAIPLDDWLRSSLRGWADACLGDLEPSLVDLMNPDAVMRLWTRHKLGAANAGGQIWAILMLQCWLSARTS